MNIYSTPILIVAVVVLIMTFLILLKNPRSALNQSYAFFGISVFIWLVGDAFLISAPDKVAAISRTRIGYTGVILIPLATYNFVIQLLRLEEEKRWLFISSIPILFFLYLCDFTSYFTNDVNVYSWGYYPKANFLQAMNNALYIILFNRSLFLLFISVIKRNNLSLLEYQRNKYVLGAFSIGMFCGVNYIPVYGINLYPFGFILMIFFLALLGYAIVKYRLMDIAIAITRTSIFVAVYSLVLGIPFALAFGWQERLIRVFGNSWWIFPLVCSTVLATAGPFIYLYIQKKAEDRLFREQRAYQNALRNASSGMIRIKDLKYLLDVVVRVVTKTVGIKYAAVYLFDKESNSYFLQALRGDIGAKEYIFIENATPLVWHFNSTQKPIVTEEVVMRLRDEPGNQVLRNLVGQLVNLNAALVVPSVVDNKLTGIFMLGEKTSGKLYTEDDLVLFSVLANQAALAIENAQFYDEVKRTHAQLFQAEKLATIGTMASCLSHQINNRFNVLSLLAGDSLDILDSVDSSGLNEKVSKAISDAHSIIKKIEVSTLRGAEIVRGILKFSTQEETKFEQINFADVLKAALDMVRYKIKLDEIDLVQNIPAGLPQFRGNLGQLQEVFFNLIDNAYDAIKEREAILKEDGYRGRINICATSDNGSLEIVISDNGIGVKEPDKKKLFVPFFTTKVTSSQKGTGLGLYVIEKIILAHSGKIKLESTYGSGTKFIISLPLGVFLKPN